MTLAALQTAGAVEPQPQASAPVSLVHRFTLPGTLRGYFDHFTVDPVGKRLFGTAVEDQRVVVFDFEQGRVLKEIQGVHKPRAVLYRPDPIAYDAATQRLFVVNGGEKAHHTYTSITVFDTAAPAQVGELRLEGIEIEGMTVETQVLVFKVASAIDTRKSPFES